MNSPLFSSIKNCQVMPLADVPCVSIEEFRDLIIGAVRFGARISSFFGTREWGLTDRSNAVRLVAVLAHDAHGALAVLSTIVEKSYLAITPECAQAHMFEREVAEQWGIEPTGHPWLKPVRCEDAISGTDRWADSSGEKRLAGVTDFFSVEGDEVHEVAVGPIHAGVIEPGHFRFQCHGEKVFHLEISLGYQHRGIEKALFGGPHKRTIYQIETAAGDTTVGHTVAYVQALESLSSCETPRRAEAIRSVGLELERLANHTGDLGALGGDVGFLPTASYCGRIRGDFLNMTALICGSRLGRGLVVPGGVRFDIDAPERLKKLTDALKRGEEDAAVAIKLLWRTPSVMSRFERTGSVSLSDCEAIGLVGPAARACGAERDARRNFSMGQYRVTELSEIPDASRRTGDVAARAYVRWAEMRNSFRFLKEVLSNLPEGELCTKKAKGLIEYLSPDALVVSIAEGWRGEICHTAITDSKGNFARYKIVDPSFHNWMGLALALRDQEISDFPLCNKSFNLSYCGFDL